MGSDGVVAGPAVVSDVSVRGAAAWGGGFLGELVAVAAVALALLGAPEGSTGIGPNESESDLEGDRGLRGLEREDEIESARLPRERRDGETDRFCRSTLAALGAGMGTTSGWDGDRARLGERGEMRPKSSSAAGG